MKMSLWRIAVTAGILGTFLSGPPAVAQTPPATPNPATPTSPAQPAAPAAVPLREQTIYVPYEKLRETFEKEGRGVYLPYEQFQELWRKARLADQPAVTPKPPRGVLLTEMDSEATLEREVMVVRGKLRLEVLGQGWHELPLQLGDTAIRSARLGTEPARITWNAPAGYTLLVENPTAASQQLELTLEYAKGLTRSPGLHAVSFAAPRAPVNRWRVRIPQRGVKLQIEPLIAATEETAAPPPAPNTPAPEETVLLAFVGAAPEVKLQWTPKAEGAAGLEALATVQAQQEVRLEEGVLRNRIRLQYDISRAELDKLQVSLPTQHKVTGVFDPNIRQWDVTTKENEQLLVIQLFEPAKKQQRVTIELEQFSAQLLQQDVVIPAVKAVGVSRQQGTVVVQIGEELRSEPVKRSGLLQVDAAELPPPLKDQPWAYAYRYAALPYELSLKAEKVQPRVRTEELVEYYLQPEGVTLEWLVLFDIQQAGLFQLELDLPGGYEVRRVQGKEAAGAAAALVDSHSVAGGNSNRLKVNLARKALGRVGLLVELHRPLSDPNLATPTGQASRLDLAIPRVALPVEGRNGRLVILAPEGLRITPDQPAGLRPVPFAEAWVGVESQRANRFPQLREVLAYVYTQDPVALVLVTERRKPQIAVRQLLTARVEAGVIKYEALLNFEVQYSSVKSLRVDFPAALLPDLRNVSPGIREQVIEPAPADLAVGETAWSLTGNSEFLGPVSIKLTWETKTAELAVGQQGQYAVPAVKPRGADRAWGQIVLAKAETLDVSAAEGFSGLRPIDPQRDLMDGVRVPDAAQAFEFHEPWSLTVRATRYQLEDIKRTSIERAVVRMVVTRSQQISVQALYRVRSAVQRLRVQLPKEAALDGDSLRLNGRPVPLEHGEEGALYIPLVNQTPDQPFLLDLRYTTPGDARLLELPVFPAQPPVQAEPAVQKVHLLVYLPEDQVLVASRGPWTDEQADPLRGLEVLANAEQTQRDVVRAQQRVSWVTQNLPVTSGSFGTFATDGRLHEFTTLRPSPPPDGALRLVVWPRRSFRGTMLGGLAILGLIGLGVRWPSRLALVFSTITLLVLAALFAPTFFLALLSPIGVALLMLVLGLWLVASAWSAVRGGMHSSAAADPRSAVLARQIWTGPVTDSPVTDSPVTDSPVTDSPGTDSAGAETGSPAADSSHVVGHEGDSPTNGPAPPTGDPPPKSGPPGKSGGKKKHG